MFIRKGLYGLILMLSLMSFPAAAAVSPQVDWAGFLSHQDPVWEQLPRQWNEGAFTGNGQLGIMFYQAFPENVLEFQLGRADVTGKGHPELPRGGKGCDGNF